MDGGVYSRLMSHLSRADETTNGQARHGLEGKLLYDLGFSPEIHVDFLAMLLDVCEESEVYRDAVKIDVALGEHEADGLICQICERTPMAAASRRKETQR